MVLAPGRALDDALRSADRLALRRALSPRHVPDAIEAVPAIPRTLTAKKLELPVKRILLGAPPEDVASRDALAQPDALDAFVAYALRRAAARPGLVAGRRPARPCPRCAGWLPGSSTTTAIRRPVCSRSSRLDPLRSAVAVAVARGRLALSVSSSSAPGPLDDQPVVRRGALDAQQHVLDLGGVEVDSADDQHVVVAAAQAGQPDRGAAALAGLDDHRADVAGPVADQRQRLLGQRGEHELALRAGLQPPPVLGVDHLDQEVVLLDVQPGACRPGTRRPRPGRTSPTARRS